MDLDHRSGSGGSIRLAVNEHDDVGHLDSLDELVGGQQTEHVAGVAAMKVRKMRPLLRRCVPVATRSSSSARSTSRRAYEHSVPLGGWTRDEAPQSFGSGASLAQALRARARAPADRGRVTLFVLIACAAPRPLLWRLR
jgi:hypothetical protein